MCALKKIIALDRYKLQF